MYIIFIYSTCSIYKHVHILCQMMSTLQSAPSLWDNFYNLHAVWSKKHVGHVGPMRPHQHLRSRIRESHGT